MVYEQSMNKGTGFHSRIRDELPRTGSSPTDQGSDLRARGTSSHHSASVPADDELSGSITQSRVLRGREAAVLPRREDKAVLSMSRPG